MNSLKLLSITTKTGWRCTHQQAATLVRTQKHKSDSHNRLMHLGADRRHQSGGHAPEVPHEAAHQGPAAVPLHGAAALGFLDIDCLARDFVGQLEGQGHHNGGHCQPWVPAPGLPPPDMRCHLCRVRGLLETLHVELSVTYEIRQCSSTAKSEFPLSGTAIILARN